MNLQTFEYIEHLSLHQQFRLIEIAADATNFEVRAMALKMLKDYLNPHQIQYAPLDDSPTERA
jgi:hypothetical protein